jgi:hypothetical protein
VLIPPRLGHHRFQLRLREIQIAALPSDTRTPERTAARGEAARRGEAFDARQDVLLQVALRRPVAVVGKLSEDIERVLGSFTIQIAPQRKQLLPERFLREARRGRQHPTRRRASRCGARLIEQGGDGKRVIIGGGRHSSAYRNVRAGGRQRRLPWVARGCTHWKDEKAMEQERGFVGGLS